MRMKRLAGKEAESERNVIDQRSTMTRRTLREHCFKMLFCTDFYPVNEADEQIEDYFQSEKEEETDENGKTETVHEVVLTPEEEKELKERVDAILLKLPEIDERLQEVTEGWKLKRMGKVELTVLRLASYEIRYDDNIPEKVAINEAVELAKKFGGSEAPAFVNGILAKLV